MTGNLRQLLTANFKRRQAGYTIIEVTLFLGISGLLFLVAVLATGSTIRNLRFSDSGYSLESYVQKQYDDLVTGVNIRDNQTTCNAGVVTSGTQTPGTSNCFLMGHLLLFKANSSAIANYNIIGTEPSTVDLSQTDEQLITAYNPQIITNTGVTSYSIPWQAFISGVRRVSTLDASAQATNALAIIRSPGSTRIVSYTYKEPAATPTIALSTIVGNATVNANKLTNYCLKSADNIGIPAKLVINGESANQNAAQIVFDKVTTEDCSGA